MPTIKQSDFYAKHRDEVDKMEADILQSINKNTSVLFTNLLSDIDGFEGEYEWRADNNVVMWSGLSLTALVALKRLLSSHRIEGSIVHLALYLVDGVVVEMPVAKSFPEKPFKSPRWLPLAFKRA